MTAELKYELSPTDRVRIISKRLLNLEKRGRDYAHGCLDVAIRHTENALRQAQADQRREWGVLPHAKAS